MTSEPTSKFIPDVRNGALLMTGNTALYLADLMLRYGSVEAYLKPENASFTERTGFFASRQHSIYVSRDTLIQTRLPDAHPYTFYNFAVLYQPGRLYQLDTSGVAQLSEGYMSADENKVWERFLGQVGISITRLRKDIAQSPVLTDGHHRAVAAGRVKLRLRQREEA